MLKNSFNHFLEDSISLNVNKNLYTSIAEIQSALQEVFSPEDYFNLNIDTFLFNPNSFLEEYLDKMKELIQTFSIAYPIIYTSKKWSLTSLLFNEVFAEIYQNSIQELLLHSEALINDYFFTMVEFLKTKAHLIDTDLVGH